MTSVAALLVALLPALLPLPVAPQVGSKGDGFDYLKQGKPSFARTAFRNQLKRNPGDLRAQGGLGLAELALGNDDAACGALLEAIEKGSTDAAVRLGLARAFLRRARSRLAVGRGDEEETRYFLLDAQQQAERAAALAPTDPQPYVVAAEALLELAELDGAKAAIEKATARGLDVAGQRRLSGQLAYHVARQQMEAGEAADYEAAKRALETLIADDPKSAELRLRLGDLHHAFEQWSAALAAWKGAFEIEPFDRPTLDLVLAYLKVPELAAAARATLESALAAAEKRVAGNDPRPGYALFCVGQARLFAREWEAAGELFRKARALDESLVLPCALGLAEAAFRTQKYDEAAREWKAAFAADREGARALLHHLGTHATVAAALQYLADVEVKRKAAEPARDLFGIAWLLLPDDPDVCNNYAFLCRETGQHAPSWEAYAHLIELAPEQPRYLNDAALILQDYLKKDFALARSLYERAIAAADALISDPLTPQVAREMAQSAKTDATNNLARLPRQ
ncbi:MAG: hypothetical protein JNL90_07670 [Planctomycetes bacterium]|nr:hypothetical protein [Planctomycetota bacterium]